MCHLVQTWGKTVSTMTLMCGHQSVHGLIMVPFMADVPAPFSDATNGECKNQWE
ncbi:uncharacterized protein PHALS_13000 [Plasmopara halstedii]|uniref:Uncharacterized protein n=1 Tax=Plasmopara halstedii TaxID=4781 RepID=A0A0P1AP06_PLAHL|nr:uncharacterized protein PHALS_13000 [Plasmopara halstedii]CEG42750.1 hypothetical protein PHALS_13000 [Plasmopara halstedii]|eukprot:XP_024579119.1 hypothetical protein PHALS_13000 [Plasmopara halstedii]